MLILKQVKILRNIMDTIQETRIYKNYRNVLKAENRHKENHAAQRRQRARKATVERYNISYVDLKTIIAKHDQINGITHEHTPDYLNELEYMEHQKAYDANPYPCRCGSTEIVRVRLHPVDYQIYGERNYIVTCYMCYMILEEDI
jgi:hypothetical protein